MKQKEKIAAQDAKIGEQESRLDTLTVRIEDTEKFIDEVSEIAYETAVEVVTDKVIEETHNADFDEIEKVKRSLTSDSSRNTPQQKSIITQTLDILMKRFRGMTDHITERLAAVFGDPAKKKALQEPIRRSIRDRLEQGKRNAEAYNAARRNDQLQKKKQQNRDR